jgi:hypothetical protein
MFVPHAKLLTAALNSTIELIKVSVSTPAGRPYRLRFALRKGSEMDAPLYPPSRAYEQPVVVPHRLDTATTSIAALLADPAAKAILLAEIPGFMARIGNEALKPHLYNFSPRSLVQFGIFKADALDRVDRQLGALPLTTTYAK